MNRGLVCLCIGLLLFGMGCAGSSGDLDEPSRESLVVTGISVHIDFAVPLSMDGFERQIKALGPAFTIELYGVYAEQTASAFHDQTMERVSELGGSVRWKLEGCGMDEPVYVTDFGEVVRADGFYEPTNDRWLASLWDSITDSMPLRDPTPPYRRENEDEWGDISAEPNENH